MADIAVGKAVEQPSCISDAARPAERQGRTFLGLLRLVRPKQWVKNGFVLAAVAFTPGWWDARHFYLGALALTAFCLASSASYIWNDWRDIESDRQNPKKANRPLVVGEVSVAFALSMAVLLVSAAFAMAAFVGTMFLAVLALYVGLQVAYSTVLKGMVVLDVMVISAGFLLRVVAGGAAVNIQVSNWLLLTTGFLALFLGFTKRRQEIKQLGSNGHAHRPVLAEYNIAFIDQMNAVLAATCIVCYGLYTVAPETIHKFGQNLILTLPFVVYGLLRYLYLVHVRNEGDNPTDVVWKDRALQVTIALWLAVFLFVIHTRPLP